jgi:8-oxo-dGTP pyrophosphatase MutT (NUDIX family)
VEPWWRRPGAPLAESPRDAVARLKAASPSRDDPGQPRQRLKNARATSAGGLVVRRGEHGPELVLGRRRRERDGVTWTLPKGTPHTGETTEQTALREVNEETGLTVDIVEPVGDIEYWFVLAGTRYHKTVHYYLMQPTGGDLEGHDHEFDEVRWVELAAAERMLSYPTERDILARATDAIGHLAG